ncbi:MAG TPA: hypothetical protein VMT15_15950 [Bryobacteraceae bacterium]|nr:hypothetical protein [Bryobacteraceae bacterium]
MKYRILIPLAAAGLVALFWAVAQPAPPPMASLFPPGAALYLEAKDLGALLADWNASAEKVAWLDSDNYEAFSRSQLFLKLSDAQTQFATAAGVPPDYALLTSVAGSGSALAMYDIGKLECLYMTKVASARAINTALWRARGTYQTRHAGNADYFVKEDPPSHRVAAFAYVGDTLVLATKESLIAGALQLMARDSVPSMASEPWFTSSVQAAGAGQSELRLVYNMAALGRTYQFRSHWVQGNVGELRQFSSGLTDLESARGEIRERRVLLRATPSASSESAESIAGQALAAVPDDAGLYRAWLRPSGGQVAALMEEKLFPAAISTAPKSKLAPMVAQTADAGSEIDLESRIDEQPLGQRNDAVQLLRDALVAAKIDTMLDVQSTKIDADRVYVRPHFAIALLTAADWNASAIRAAIGSAAEGLWAQGAAATWRSGPNGVSELDGLGKVAMAVQGKWLVVGDSAEMVNAVFSRRNRQAIPGAAYAAGWRHARELPNFRRLTTLIDFPQVPAETEQPAGAEPPFFSGNLASFGAVLKRVDMASIIVHDAGTMLREAVVYRMIP